MIKLQIIGNLGRDAVLNEVRGKNVINFSVAHTERYKDSLGNQKERITWADCSYWTDRTGIVPYLKKNTSAYVEGIPFAEPFTSKDGKAGVALRLRVTNVEALGSRSKADDLTESTGTEIDTDQDLRSPDSPGE